MSVILFYDVSIEAYKTRFRPLEKLFGFRFGTSLVFHAESNDNIEIK